MKLQTRNIALEHFVNLISKIEYKEKSLLLAQKNIDLFFLSFDQKKVFLKQCK